MSYSKPRVKFKGHFNGKYVVDEQAYRDKKDWALKHREKEKTTASNIRRDFFEGKMVLMLHDNKGMTFKQIAEQLSTPEHPITDEGVRKRYHKTLEMMGNPTIPEPTLTIGKSEL